MLSTMWSRPGILMSEADGKINVFSVVSKASSLRKYFSNKAVLPRKKKKKSSLTSSPPCFILSLFFRLNKASFKPGYWTRCLRLFYPLSLSILDLIVFDPWDSCLVWSLHIFSGFLWKRPHFRQFPFWGNLCLSRNLLASHVAKETYYFFQVIKAKGCQ